jgi:hypothetical protein
MARLKHMITGVLILVSAIMTACGDARLIDVQSTATASSTPPVSLSATQESTLTPVVPSPTPSPEPTATALPSSTPTASPTSTPTSTPLILIEGPLQFGLSYLGYPLLYYRLGNGPIGRMIVGGIHGGYELNTVILMTEFLDRLSEAPELIPPDVTLYVVPCLNPDGAVGGRDRVNGRLNGNQVDLNRNWDYRWQPIANHGPWPVSGGSAPFSEPESEGLRDLILDKQVDGVIIYHSAMAAVFQGVGTSTSDTVELALLMVEKTGYRYAPTDVYYPPTTGNAIDWLTINGITTVEIELSTHEEIDWDINWRALMAFLYWDLHD